LKHDSKIGFVMRFSCSALPIFALALVHLSVLAQTSTYKNPVDGKEYTAELLQAYYEKISKDMDVPAVLGAVSFQLLMVVRDHSNLQGHQNPE